MRCIQFWFLTHFCINFTTTYLTLNDKSNDKSVNDVLEVSFWLQITNMDLKPAMYFAKCFI
jgi:hypothetical protein